jgi:hypothetical protein
MLLASKYVSGVQLGREAAKSCVKNYANSTLNSGMSFETLASERLLATILKALSVAKPMSDDARKRQVLVS